MHCPFTGRCRAAGLPASLPASCPASALHNGAAIPAAAALRLHSALDLTALGGQRSPCNHAAVAVAAVVPNTTGLGQATGGPAFIPVSLLPPPRGGRAGGGASRGGVPRRRGKIAFARG